MAVGTLYAYTWNGRNGVKLSEKGSSSSPCLDPFITKRLKPFEFDKDLDRGPNPFRMDICAPAI